MSANQKGSVMNKQHLIPVNIPGEVKPLMLPPMLANALNLILVSDSPGIDTFELQRNGIHCVRSTIYRMRKLGIRIATTREPAYDNTGNLCGQIGHYSHEGKAGLEADQQTLAEQNKLSVFNKLTAILKIIGII